MIVTIKADITWDGKLANTINSQSEKKFKEFFKDLTGAVDVDVLDWSCWTEEEEDYDETEFRGSKKSAKTNRKIKK